jgi:predicted Zn-dependent peptidase
MTRERRYLHALLGAALLAPALGLAATEPVRSVRLPATREVRLANGATFLLAERRDLPLIAFQAVIRGGSLADPPGKEGVASLTADMLRKGAGKRSALQIAAATDGVGGILGTSAGLETSRISGEFLSRDLALLLGLLTDLLRTPTFPPDEFNKLKQQTVEAIAAEKDDAGSVLGTYARVFFYGSHPYGRPTEGDERTVAGLTRDDVIAYYRANYGADRLIVAMVGDFDSRAMEAKLREALGDWSRAPGPPQAAPATARRTGRRVLLVDKPDATQTYFWIGNLGVARNDPDRVALDVANTGFGGRYTSMLNTALRIQSGLTYGAASRSARFAQAGTISIGSYTKTESTEKAVNLALDTLARLRRDHLGGSVLSSVKTYIQGQFPPDFETSDAIAATLVDLRLYGQPPDEIESYLPRVAATDSAAVARTIDRVYPPAGDLTMVFVGNAAKIRPVAARYGAVTEVGITKPVLEALRP